MLVLFLTNTVFSQEKPNQKRNKLRVFMNFSGNRSLLQNDTKYWNFSFGLKSKCKYKVGLSYSWLRGSFTTDNYPVNLIDYPNAQSTTKTDIKFYSLMFEPILIKGRKMNISLPINTGFTQLISSYKIGVNNFENYHESNPIFASAALDFNFRVLAIMKISFRVGYRHLLSDLPVAANTFSTPFYGFGLKLGGMCK